MERILIAEEKNANTIVKKRLHYDLLNKKKQGWDLVIVVCAYDACDACKKLNGKEYDIDEAIKTQPLPPKDCTCLRCTCSY